MKNIEEKKDQLEKELQQSDEKLQKLIEGIAYIITEIVEIRDPYLRGHHQRVSKLATAIAQEMKLPQDKIEGVKMPPWFIMWGRLIYPLKSSVSRVH